jgi:hypothetical protein
MASYLSGFEGAATFSQPASIANGQQSSAAIDCNGLTLTGIKFPAVFTGTAVTFETCDTVDGTYVPVYNSAGPVSYTVAQGRYYAIDPKDFYGIRFLKIKSGSSEGGARSLVLSMKGF